MFQQHGETHRPSVSSTNAILSADPLVRKCGLVLGTGENPKGNEVTERNEQRRKTQASTPRTDGGGAATAATRRPAVLPIGEDPVFEVVGVCGLDLCGRYSG
eukprot:3077821-Rhodomonas_salina.1